MAIIKASNVMFAAGSERIQGISTQPDRRNDRVREGRRERSCGHRDPRGRTHHGSITNEAIEDLGLAEGAAALAIVKSTDVIVGVE